MKTKTLTVHNGVFYFPTRERAVEWANANGWRTDRIMDYERGFAVQSGKSGNYAGPDDLHPVAFRGWTG